MHGNRLRACGLLPPTVADDWEDWEDESFEPKLEVGAAPANGQKFETKGQAVLAKAREPDQSRFAGEDEEEEAPPAWDKSVPQPQQVPSVLVLAASCVGRVRNYICACCCLQVSACVVARGDDDDDACCAARLLLSRHWPMHMGAEEGSAKEGL